MSPNAKTNSKVILGVATSLIVIIGFAFSLGVGFAKNESDHVLIQMEQNTQKAAIRDEVVRSKAIDGVNVSTINKLVIDIEVIKSTVLRQEDTLDKIEKKL